VESATTQLINKEKAEQLGFTCSQSGPLQAYGKSIIFAPLTKGLALNGWRQGARNALLDHLLFFINTTFSVVNLIGTSLPVPEQRDNGHPRRLGTCPVKRGISPPSIRLFPPWNSMDRP
jgi:hypothetical protein